jgi:hypothetical protein
MATRKRNPQTVVLDPSESEELGALGTLEYTGDPTTSSFTDEVDASLCLNCGEPLAWHEEACTPVAAPTTKPETNEPESAPAVPGPASPGFAYALGQPVQPVYEARPCPVIWRGQVKERHPQTGLLYRVNVYRLNNSFWDCYYEADLQAA